MKTVFTFYLVWFTSIVSAQNENQWEQYLKENRPQAYVSYYFSKGGKSLHNISALIINDTFYLVERKERKLVQAKQMGSVVYDTLYQHWRSLEYLKNHLHGFNNELSKSRKDQKNEQIEFMQVAILYGGIHFNHYRLKTEEEILKIKNKKLMKAYTVLNKLVELLHQNI